MTESQDFKFDVVIGNPPYQDESVGDSTSAPPVYDKFMDAAYSVGHKVELITPARFLFNAGSTPKSWNQKMLNDEHLKVMYFNQNSAEVFPGTDIKGGVAVTYRDSEVNYGAIRTFTTFPELKSILDKVSRLSQKSLSSIMTGRGLYRLTETALKEHPEITKIQSKGHKTDVGTGAFKLFKDLLFFTKKPNDSDAYVKVLGLLDEERRYLWIKSKYLSKPNNFDKFKVILPNSNGCGLIGEVQSSPVIGEPIIGKPLMGYTETFISVGSFETYTEAESAYKYVCSKFARAMLSILKITQHNPKEKWTKVPLQDFSDASDIRWSVSVDEIDKQLYNKYSLNQHEIDFIETHVKEMA